MTTLAPPPAVTEYANAVRDHLAGLDAETLDELTGGLEADLAEALAERMPDGGAPDLASVTSVFGSPATYAEELRVAAGVELPAAAGKRRRTIRDAVGTFRSDLANDWQRWRTEHRWFGAVVDFLVALRPVWWVARGWVIFMWFTFDGSGAAPFGHGFYQHVALLGLVVVSVLWGQQRIGQQRWLRRAALLVSTIAALFLLPLLNAVGHQLGGANGYENASSYDAGYHDGFNAGENSGRQQAMAWYGDGTSALTGPTNLFVYGSDGQPIADARIVDQNGEPVVLINPSTGAPWGDWEGGFGWDDAGVPVALLAGSEQPLNLYPYSYVPDGSFAERTDAGGDPELVGNPGLTAEPQWPVESLDPIESPDATDAPTDEAARPSDGATQPEQPAESEQPAEPTEPGATTTG